MIACDVLPVAMFWIAKQAFFYFWSEHRNVGLSRFRICGLFSTFQFPLLCKLLHFSCLPRMLFLILGLVGLHTCLQNYPEVTKTDYLWLLVTKWLQFGGIGQNMKSDYSKTPPPPSLSDRHPHPHPYPDSGFRINYPDHLHPHSQMYLLSLKR